MENGTEHSIYKKGGSLESMRPKSKGHRGLTKKSKTTLKNMTVVTFSRAVVLRSVRGSSIPTDVVSCEIRFEI